MKITPDLLARSMGCPPEAAEAFAPHLDAACAHYGISDTPARLAAFLAQIGHESGGLRHVREIASGEAYEGRADLGNTEPGDGRRFRGRGLIQLTGRGNARRMTALLREERDAVMTPDFEAEPEALESPEWAAWSAAAYWNDNNLSRWADLDQFDIVSNLINTGRKDRTANGTEDRKRRHMLAKQALAATPAEADIPTQPTEAPKPPVGYIPAGEAADYPPPEGRKMPIPLIVSALLPSLIEAIPRLGKLFGSGSKVSERNTEAVELAMKIAKEAVGAVNEQETIEKIKADPAAAQVATRAIEHRWLELSEGGGGGIEGARKVDAAYAAGPWHAFMHSPSFWIAVLLLPLVYMIVANVVGVLGMPLSDEVRSAISNGVVGLVIGSLAGYYFGQTTSRNRTSS